MRSVTAYAVLGILWSVQGCGNTEPFPPDPTTKGVSTSATGKNTLDPPRFAPVEVSISDKGGSCTTTFAPLPLLQGSEVIHGSTCGHPGSITKLSWQYLGTTDQGDRYEFERTFPVDESGQTTTKKEVIYTGKEVLLFNDEDSTVRMRPAESNEQSVESEWPVGGN